MTKKSRARTKAPMPGTLGEALEQVGFEPLGRIIKVGRVRKVRSPSNIKWRAPVAEFLSKILPGAPRYWRHLNIGAYEAACEALVRLGYGASPADGARPVSEAGILGYRHCPGTRYGVNPSGLVRANIRAAHGSGPAYLDPEAFPAFESLGLILGGCWTEIAETILWRDCPAEWAIDFTLDDRFIHASDLAIATLPQQIADEIEKVTTIAEQDVAEWLAFAKLHSPERKTRHDALKSLRFWCAFGLDGIFHRRWRLNDGWLDINEGSRAIHIPHDPVALNMRAVFAARYLPGLPFLSK
jgi:hypothetical protein